MRKAGSAMSKGVQVREIDLCKSRKFNTVMNDLSRGALTTRAVQTNILTKPQIVKKSQ